MLDFASFNSSRKPEYRLVTRIESGPDGTRQVIKAPVSEASAGHLERLRAVLADPALDLPHFRYVRAQLVGQRLVFPYLAGDCVAGEARAAVLAGDRAGLLALLDQVIGWYRKDLAADLQPFVASDAFTAWFGTPPEPQPEPALAPPQSNIDLQLENLYRDGAQGFWVIDAEWVFSFAIPVDYPVYRLLRRLSAGIIDVLRPGWLTLAELFTRASISAVQQTWFAAMEAQFNQRVFAAEAPIRPVFSVPELLARTHFSGQVFLSEPASEEQSERYTYSSLPQRLTIALPASPLNRLRFDPIDGPGLVAFYEAIGITSDGSRVRLPIQSDAAHEVGSMLVFNAPDPKIWILIGDEERTLPPVKSVELSFRVLTEERDTDGGEMANLCSDLTDLLQQTEKERLEAKMASQTDELERAADRYGALEMYLANTQAHVGKLEDQIRLLNEDRQALQRRLDRHSPRWQAGRAWRRFKRSRPGKAVRILVREGPGALIRRLRGRRLTGPAGALPRAVVDPARLNRLQTRFSILMPVYNVEPQWLEQAIASVRQQSYPNWQLCLVDDGSTSQATRDALDQLQQGQSPLTDKRITIHMLERNRGISAASNKAASLAQGDYLVLMDNDDELHPDALYAIACAIEEQPADRPADVVYTDEDKIDLQGQHRFPLHKPDWSPDLLRAQMYIGHIFCIRKAVFAEAGGFDSRFDGAQDYDLALRLCERTDRIVHVPQVLYSWREIPTSTAASPEAKPRAHLAGLEALDAHLKRIAGVGAAARETGHFFVYRPQYPLPDDTLVSIIIPFKDRVELTAACLDSIFSVTSSAVRFEIVLVDNGSAERATAEWLTRVQAEHADLRVIRADIDFNWSRLNNLGARASLGSVLVFLNNDTLVISPDWLEQLAGLALRPTVGVVGPLLLYEDDTIQHAGIVVGIGGWADHVFKGRPAEHFGSPYISPLVMRNVTAVTGACQVIARGLFADLGGFDESFQICGSDVALCIAALDHGRHNVYTPNVSLYHLESKSRDATIPENDFARSYACYAPYREKGDPFWNPNLSYTETTPTVRLQ